MYQLAVVQGPHMCNYRQVICYLPNDVWQKYKKRNDKGSVKCFPFKNSTIGG